MKKVLVVFGTRPEAVKLAPLIKKLQASPDFDVVSCTTGQHAHMVMPVCEFFGITPDHDLEVMVPGQTLNHIASKVISRLSSIMEIEKPDYCVVQGDTSTTFAAAFCAFNHKVKVVHLEAGLRTGDLQSPWPEEANRVLTSRITDLHFAPTWLSTSNLIQEGVPTDKVFTVGNTVVDAALMARDLIRRSPAHINERFAFLGDSGRPLILFTMHRRESFGEPVARVFTALNEFAQAHDVDIVFPVHHNPNVSGPAAELLTASNIHRMPPLDYDELIYVLDRCRFVMTDSGGIVEEAPTFNKPAIVLRETTERPESVDAGLAVLCGTDPEVIFSKARELLEDGEAFRRMSEGKNPYGDGTTVAKIVDRLAKESGLQNRVLQAAE